MAFHFPQKVLFKHCDPAGIVFYPRYFEMLNDCVEAFFDEVLGLPFETLHATGGVPTAEITTRFLAPSRHGDHLTIALTVTRVGQSSLGLMFTADCGDETRFTARSTLVLLGENGRPRPWPEGVRQILLDREEAPAHVP
ncbi:acyl-CoA thioesterase [Nioella sediminis]|jgi:4-hydroxybenzoyl-CoA thioesterase|uniref:acyl-CoA thioesterase n=1 Tax=Nioella sediminis TaxID=1912092 RepID=UPI0008FD3A25|nr:thioesterase family protein [Nioella sediminis]TBX14721.1 thioesterase [Roseovarius sp. JS7-11]